ncbi:hypothetical protein CC80DRAFT_489164 [Byssothecium circinans]|uniref:Uncharacterized protein n=1 Tax=Byssothecium circinans TaxID=147558 RepID=A0A6A5U721_9PLEO|nr:hypothetical protein CC80DRAFT_489164 [Byssothecium circinans]
MPSVLRLPAVETDTTVDVTNAGRKVNVLEESANTKDLMVKIHDLKNAGPFVDAVLANAEELSRITRIEILTCDPEDDVEVSLPNTTTGQEEPETAQSAPLEDQTAEPKAKEKEEEADEETARARRIAAAEQEKKQAEAEWEILSTPLIRLLTKLQTLKEFHWLSPNANYAYAGFRPASFFHALYTHAPSLQSLTLGFFVHELHDVPAPPPTTRWPKLRELNIEAGTAHGDDGTAVDAILRQASCSADEDGGAESALETLTFYWPRCDLEDCQIQNISWAYAFPSLKEMKVNGYLFAAQSAAFSDFLARCPELVSFSDGVETGLNEKEQEQQREGSEEETKKVLAETTLPKLEKLALASVASPRSVRQWFDNEAKRPIREVEISSAFSVRSVLEDLARVEPEERLQGVQVLGVSAGIDEWRPRRKEPDTDSDEGSRPASKKQDQASPESTEQATQKEKEDSPSAVCRALQTVFKRVPNLREFTADMESANTMFTDEGGKWVNPPPSDEEDLKRLMCITSELEKLEVLRVRDSRMKALSTALFQGDMELPLPPNLKELHWEGELGMALYFGAPE